MLVMCLSFLPAKDQLSIVRVCRHLRTHVIADSSLWSCVDQIDHPNALSFVLDRAKDSAVDIINLHISSQNDDRLQVVASHMHHLRTLDLHIDGGLTIAGHAAFTTPAPLLQRLSLFKAQGTSATVSLTFGLNARNYPSLSSLQLKSVRITSSIYHGLRTAPSLRIISIDATSPPLYYPMAFSYVLPSITTVNLELAGWGEIPGSSSPIQALDRINLRWTKPGPFVPNDAIPEGEAWESIRVVHVVHVVGSPGSPSRATSIGANFLIPSEIESNKHLWVRTSATGDRQAHVRVIHRDGLERVFCGLHQTTIFGLVACSRRKELSEITAATTAVALNALSNARRLALRRIRLVSDTQDTAWVSIFTQDMLNIPTLELLELAIDADGIAGWTTAVILRVLGSCMAAGHNLQKVSFLGFTPDSRCATRAEAFADEVVVDTDWREPESERVWFTEPAFTW